jgi:Mn-containing catalase
MSDKPTYLSLLNAIAVNETRAYHYLQRWIEVTPNPDVRAVLCTVAAREGEHGMSFAKRLNELGYSVREKDQYVSDDRVPAAESGLSDLEKIEKFGLHELDKQLSFFDTVFKDHTIDIQTGELLGRYIAEEFDSARLIRRCYEQLLTSREAKTPLTAAPSA